MTFLTRNDLIAIRCTGREVTLSEQMRTCRTDDELDGFVAEAKARGRWDEDALLGNRRARVWPSVSVWHDAGRAAGSSAKGPNAGIARDGARMRSLGAVWEPACGDGALVREIRAAGIPCCASDLIDRGCPDSWTVDFYTCLRSRAPSIITNPPYSEINARGGQGSEPAFRWLDKADHRQPDMLEGLQ